MSAAQNLKPWKPGQSGNPGGKRKKIFPYVDEILKAAGLEPIQEIIKRLPQLNDRDQVNVWLELLPYVHAKPKQIEDTQEDELEKLSTNELLRLVKDKISEMEKK